MYLVFIVLFAGQSSFGADHAGASWAIGLFILAVGVYRARCGERILQGERQQVASLWKRFLISITLQAIAWGGFLAYALWVVRGNGRLEMAIVVAMAGYATIGSVLLAGCPLVAWLQAGVQIVPALIWSISVRDRYGMLMILLVCAFVAGGILVPAWQYRYMVEMFRAQLPRRKGSNASSIVRQGSRGRSTEIR
jgi:hypothetical protein